MMENHIAKPWYRRNDIPITELSKTFFSPAKEYRPYAFWFWIETYPMAQKFGKQAKEMAEKGLSGGYVQDRGFPKPLSSDYFACFDEAVAETEKAGLSLGYCEPARYLRTKEFRGDDPELEEISLRCTVINLEKGQTVSLPSAFFTVVATVEEGLLDSSSLRVLSEETTRFSALHSPCRLFSFFCYTNASSEGCQANLLTPKITHRIREVIHDPYFIRYQEQLGDTISGHFFDWEGDYGYKLAYSPELESAFFQRCGEDFRRLCPLLLEKDGQGLWMKVRYQYLDTISELYSHYLFGAISDILAEKGLYFSTHLWEERLLGQAILSGDPMRIYRSVSLPGIDHLGKDYTRTRSYKEAQSVCELDGKRMHCEIMGCANWDITPWELRAMVNNALSLSVSHFSLHGVYSDREHITDAIFAPDFYNWAPMWGWMSHYTDYITRGSYLVSQGYLLADVLLYNPLESAWALVGDGVFDDRNSFEDMWVYDKPGLPDDCEFGREITRIDRYYTDAMEILRANAIGFLIGDRYYLENMTVTNGSLCYREHQFRTVVLPPLKILGYATAKKLLSFAQSGGYIYALGELPVASAEQGDRDPVMIALMDQLKKEVTFIAVEDGLQHEIGQKGLQSQCRFVEGNFPLHVQKRRIDDHSFYWISNDTPKVHDCRLLLPEEKGSVVIWNLETGTRKDYPSEQTAEGIEISLHLEVAEGFFLEVLPKPDSISQPHSEWIKEEIQLEGEWRIAYDSKAQGTASTGQELPLPKVLREGFFTSLKDWQDLGLETFSGCLTYEKDFVLSGDVDELDIDLGQVRHMAAISVDNGEVMSRFWAPYRFSVKTPLEKGVHTLRVIVGNTLANQLRRLSVGQMDMFWSLSKLTYDNFSSGLLGQVTLYGKKKG